VTRTHPSTGTTFPLWLNAVRKPTYIDIVAMYTASSSSSRPSIRLSVLNRHPTADWTLDVEVKGLEVGTVSVQEMYSDDLGATVSIPAPAHVGAK
jgi:alpha-N-arabinofuranosidase